MITCPSGERRQWRVWWKEWPWWPWWKEWPITGHHRGTIKIELSIWWWFFLPGGGYWRWRVQDGKGVCWGKSNNLSFAYWIVLFRMMALADTAAGLGNSSVTFCHFLNLHHICHVNLEIKDIWSVPCFTPYRNADTEHNNWHSYFGIICTLDHNNSTKPSHRFVSITIEKQR